MDFHGFSWDFSCGLGSLQRGTTYGVLPTNRILRDDPEKVDDSNRSIEHFQQDIGRSQPRNRDFTPAQIVTTENLDTSETKW